MLRSTRAQQGRKKHIVCLTMPAFGHAVPLVELATAIAQRHREARVTFATSAAMIAEIAKREVLDPASGVATEPIHDGLECYVDADSLPKIISTMDIMKTVSFGFLRDLHERSPIDLVVVGIFLAPIATVLKELGIPFAFFCPMAALGLRQLMAIGSLESDPPSTATQAQRPTNLTPEQAAEILKDPKTTSQFLHRDPRLFTPELVAGLLTMVSAIVENIADARYVFMNTFTALEESDIKTLKAIPCAQSAKLCPIGPVSLLKYTSGSVTPDGECSVQPGTEDTLKSKTHAWLEQQAPRSVLYISFGSIATLSAAQISEFATALAELGCPFIWSLRAAQSALLPQSVQDAFCVDQTASLADVLSRRGLVVPWAPQRDILSHAATSAFISHCGWNGTLESIAAGVPLVAWPMFAEQHLNALLVLATGNGLMIEGTKIVDGRVVPAAEIVAAAAAVMDVHGQYFGKAQQLRAAAWSAVSKSGESASTIDAIVESL